MDGTVWTGRGAGVNRLAARAIGAIWTSACRGGTMSPQGLETVRSALAAPGGMAAVAACKAVVKGMAEEFAPMFGK